MNSLRIVLHAGVIGVLALNSANAQNYLAGRIVEPYPAADATVKELEAAMKNKDLGKIVFDVVIPKEFATKCIEGVEFKDNKKKTIKTKGVPAQASFPREASAMYSVRTWAVADNYVGIWFENNGQSVSEPGKPLVELVKSLSSDGKTEFLFVASGKKSVSYSPPKEIVNASLRKIVNGNDSLRKKISAETAFDLGLSGPGVKPPKEDLPKDLDPFRGLRIHAFADGDELVAAWELGKQKFRVATYELSGTSKVSWKQKSQADVKALDRIGGVARDDDGNIFLLTVIEEPHPIREKIARNQKPNKYRDGVINIHKIKGKTATLFADLNSAAYIGDHCVMTPLTRGRSRLGFQSDDDILGSAMTHWWTAAHDTKLAHQRNCRFALGEDATPVFKDNVDAANWHTNDIMMMMTDENMFTTETTELGLCIKRLGLAEDGEQSHGIIYTTPGKTNRFGDGLGIQLAGISGKKGTICIGFAHNGEVKTISVDPKFQEVDNKKNEWFYETTDSKFILKTQTWGDANDKSVSRTNARMVDLQDGSNSYLVWEEWKEDKFVDTKAIRIGNGGGNGSPHSLKDGDTSLRVGFHDWGQKYDDTRSSDAVVLTHNKKKYVTWLYRESQFDSVYACMVEDTGNIGNAMIRSLPIK